MRHAVLGLMQDDTNGRLLLVRKTKPDIWANLWGLPGGHIRDDKETAEQAIIRKFDEELGVKTVATDWTLKAVLETPRGNVHVFYAIAPVYRAQKLEDEAPVFVPHDSAWDREPVIPNLRWLIPLVLSGDILQPVRITHR